MRVIKARNVNDAFAQGVALLRAEGVKQGSRAGDVLVMDTPVTTVYERPTERVLFDETRDANPFFHLFESLWMLGGRSDAAYLDQFVRDFGSRFAEPEDGHIWGAYGRRWRDWFEDDQLDVVVDLLKKDPTDRRVVIEMWDANRDLAIAVRDVPCNTHVYPRVRVITADDGTGVADSNYSTSVIDLTVLCRSNDAIFGAYGANAVHFSVLQEYLAARIGIGVGRMYQVSNNFHAYVDVFEKKAPDPQSRDTANQYEGSSIGSGRVRVGPSPMVTVPSEFDRDVDRFLDRPHDSIFGNKWFHSTAVPMLRAHECWRSGSPHEAVEYASQVEARDWRLAAQQWLARRARP